ncbi:MAG TPA: flagellar biosynthesis protein FlhB [Desulfobacterales bacterium]|nr:flagellar biosynthesis protein FlhB [Desulfobacterales bacterium]
MKKKELEKAVAILYDSQKSASPKVIASGQGEVAKRIIETAREAGVHIQEDANLVELLSKIDLGEEIPAELYQTVAEVLAFVYQVNEKFKNKLKP